jgi:hypothetical protein
VVLRYLGSRPAVFLLASLSFACLLGAFYGLWSMRVFACWVFPPAIALLVWAARRDGKARTWIVEGALGGIFAAVVYDLFRLPFVLNGYPLFGVFPRFGQMLLGAAPTDFGPAVQIAGWAYHFSNGAALGIMFLAMAARPTPRVLMWGAAAWALCVETFLLITPYYSFFKLKLNYTEFLFLTLSAHLVFGIALGWWCARRASNKSSSATPLQTAG